MSFEKDPRPAALLNRFHKRARRHKPLIQPLGLVILAPILMILGRVRIRGLDNLPAQHGYVLGSNHPSLMDPLFLSLALRRRLRFIAKSELFSGWQGWLLSQLGAFPIRRGSWDTEAFTTAETVIKNGQVVVIFPEGGNSPPGGYREAKNGIGHLALRTGAPVLPVRLQGLGRPNWLKPLTWSKVTITLGAPLIFHQNDQPTRAESQLVAEQVMRVIVSLPDRD